MNARFACFIWPVLLTMFFAQAGLGQLGPKSLAAPKWVQMTDQGANSADLKGLHTPRGIKVEVIAAVPDSPVEHDGWRYQVRDGKLLRRRPHDPELLQQLQASATANKGPPTIATSDGKSIEQSLVNGIADDAKPALGPDGCLYLSCDNGNHKLQAWNGAKAAVIRSGAIFRLWPDGSRLEEFARGLARPSALAFDSLGNAFCIDHGAPNSSFAAARLIHVLPGGDCGWLTARDDENDKAGEPPLLEPDPVRASPRGDRPGTLPAMLQLPGDSPSGVVAYHGSAFPDFFQGLLLVADSNGHAVQAYSVERDGATFRQTAEFDLIKSRDNSFRPTLVSQGLDGSIYVQSTSNEQSRFYRLTWGGTDDAPAISPPAADRLEKIAATSADELLKLLESPDDQVRQSAAHQIVARSRADEAFKKSAREHLAALLANERLTPPVRAYVIHAAAPLADKAIRAALCQLLASENAEIVRLAADALGHSPPTDEGELADVADHLKGLYGRASDACSERALQFALARLAVAGIADAAEWGFEATSVTHGPNMSRYVFDGHARALEMVPGAAKELMLGNLDVAINLDVGEPLERQRIKEFVTLTAQNLRTRELADFLDALLRGDDDLFVKIEAPLEARLIACYQNVLTDPPINADAVVEWLDKHPGGPLEVEIAALETLSLVGTTKQDAVHQLADRLLAQPASAVTLAQRLLTGHLDRALLPRITAALERHAAADETGEAKKWLAELKKLPASAP